MYALAICGSPHEHGNTALLLETVLEPLIRHGWEAEIFPLAGKQVRGCVACGQCIKAGLAMRHKNRLPERRKP